MSVALLVSKASEEDHEEYQPVATEGVFLSFWMPIIRELKLVWLPHFQSGIVLTDEDLPMVIDELEQFSVEAEKLSQVKAGFAGVRLRALALEKRLRELQTEPFLEVFVG